MFSVYSICSRAFCTRVALDGQARVDLSMWGEFLAHWNGVNMFILPFSDNSPILWTDATAHSGFAAIWGNRWFRDSWPSETTNLPSFYSTSDLFEVYPIVAATRTWGHLWTGHTVKCFTDNTAVDDIINKGRSSSLTIMSLVKRLTWLAATLHFHLVCEHVPGSLSTAADALSRSNLLVFFLAHSTAERIPDKPPSFQELILD